VNATRETAKPQSITTAFRRNDAAMNEIEACANPLLLGWVGEWLDFARDKNTKGVITYRHAYDSLKACPITFQHPSQLQQLRGFGPKLCERLTQKLKEHCESNGLPMPKVPRKKKVAIPGQEGADDEDVSVQAPKKQRKKKPYVPAYRSGAYAIIMALATLDEGLSASNGMTKTHIVEIGQPLCDSSFSAPSDPTKFYTAWNSIKTLLEKDLVQEKGRPLRRYALTDEGWEVANRIKAAGEPGQLAAQRRQPEQAAEGRAPEVDNPGQARSGNSVSRNAFLLSDDDVDIFTGDNMTTHRQRPRSPSADPVARKQLSEFYNIVSDGPEISEDSALPTVSPINLRPYSFTVELLLDVREVRAKSDRDYMQDELRKLGVKPIMRSLDLGDAQWVAKPHDPSVLGSLGAEGEEVVLDYIVERKRLDDLVASIKDGRFHEQKFRLRRSGVRNVIYLVEEISMDSLQLHRIEDSITSAMAQVQVVNGYFLKRTQKMDDTIRYLARMTKMLKKMYEGRTLSVIPASVLTSQNYLPLLQHLRQHNPDRGYYISYPAFASLASKSDMLTLRDVFLKMLMTTKGVTGEKAIEIQKRWKTPYDFVKAYEACGSGETAKKRKRDMVATELRHVVAPRKKIGRALSERIAEVWGDA